MRRKEIKKQATFFSAEERQEKLVSVRDTLQRLNQLIPWEEFRKILIQIRMENEVKGGRPPYDEILMFKCVILQSLYNLSDEELEYQILDRLSFMEFLGLNIASDVPDHNTIWRFRELLKKHDLTKRLFDLFDTYICRHGFYIRKGLMTDATFIDAPKQQNTPEENAAIKEGETPESFDKKSPQEWTHKDVDARWAKKGDERHYGYKDHVTADTEHKFIREYLVTPASVYDGTPFLSIIPDRAMGEQSVYADSAYGSSENLAELDFRGFIQEICEKGYKGHPLTEEQKKENNRKSKIRCRVEHIFGDMTNRMKTLSVRTIGLARAEVKIGLMNLAYNMRRYLTLTKTAARSV